MALLVDPTHGEIHHAGNEVIGGDVQISGLMVPRDRLGRFERNVAVKVSQRGGQGAVGTVRSGLIEKMLRRRFGMVKKMFASLWYVVRIYS